MHSVFSQIHLGLATNPIKRPLKSLITWHLLKADPDISFVFNKYEGRLKSNAHSEISRKRDHVFKQTKAVSKVQYFSYKLTYLFFDIVALSFNTFFPT